MFRIITQIPLKKIKFIQLDINSENCYLIALYPFINILLLKYIANKPNRIFKLNNLPLTLQLLESIQQIN